MDLKWVVKITAPVVVGASLCIALLYTWGNPFISGLGVVRLFGLGLCLVGLGLGILFVYYLDRYRPVDGTGQTSGGEASGTAIGHPPVVRELYTLSEEGRNQACPSCGEPMSYDEGTRTTFCPNCTLPPPKIPDWRRSAK